VADTSKPLPAWVNHVSVASMNSMVEFQQVFFSCSAFFRRTLATIFDIAPLIKNVDLASSVPSDDASSIRDALPAIHNQIPTPIGEGVPLRLAVGDVPSTETSRELEALGIRSLTLQRNKGIGIFAYQIKFENDRPGSFAFTDETGDVYRATALRKKSHSIAYNSRAPTIVNVKSF
jgi:hypothetical protein